MLIYFFVLKEKNTFKIFKIQNFILPFMLIFIIIFTVIFSNKVYNVAHDAFLLWVNNVIPSLLPFFICIELLKKTNFLNIIGKLLNPLMRPIFNVPGVGAFALSMGITSGYPVGAKVASDLYKDKLCTKEEAERLIAFTNSSGPLFIIGAIGIGMFENQKIGLLLLLTHFLAAITVGLLFKFYKYHKTFSIISYTMSNSNTINISKIGSIMAEAINKSISTLLLICGYIVFFAVLNEVISLTLFKNISNPLIIGILNGILEITSGIKKLSIIDTLELNTLLPLVAFILGFGGFSVHMQVASILSETNLSMKPYLLGKLIQGIFASLYTFLILKYTNFISQETITAFSYYTTTPSILNESYNLFRTVVSLTSIGILTALIFKKKRKKV